MCGLVSASSYCRLPKSGCFNLESPLTWIALFLEADDIWLLKDIQKITNIIWCCIGKLIWLPCDSHSKSVIAIAENGWPPFSVSLLQVTKRWMLWLWESLDCLNHWSNLYIVVARVVVLDTEDFILPSNDYDKYPSQIPRQPCMGMNVPFQPELTVWCQRVNSST